MKLLAPIMILAYSSTAFAADGAVEEVGSVASVVLGHTIEVVAAVLLVLMSALARKGIKYFEKKTNIEIPSATEAMIAGFAGTAVNYAKEKAHQFRQDNKTKMKGPEKLEAALGFGLALAEEHGLTDLAKDKLTAYVEAKLGETRKV